MVTLTFKHNCPEGCSTPGQVIELRPDVQGNAYAYHHPRCVNTHVPLELLTSMSTS